MSTTPKDLNDRVKKFWEQKTREIDERISKYPEDVEYAVTRFKKDVMKEIDPKKIDSPWTISFWRESRRA
jgi:hypothetical protein